MEDQERKGLQLKVEAKLLSGFPASLLHCLWPGAGHGVEGWGGGWPLVQLKVLRRVRPWFPPGSPKASRMGGGAWKAWAWPEPTGAWP